MLHHSKFLGLSVAAVAAGVLGMLAPQARADVYLYATGMNGQTAGTINLVDVTTSTVTPYLTPSGDDPDSIIFANSTTLLYTNFAGGTTGAGQLRKINTDGTGDGPVTGIVVSGLTGPADLCLSPDGTTVLLSDFTDGKIYKVTNPLTAPMATVFAPETAVGPNGILFTPNGNLYANLGVRDSGTQMSVNKLDPTTGAILASSSLYPGLDGLTYDSVTGMLFATERDNNKLLEIDPNNLSGTGTELPILNSSGVAMTIPELDGIESDGLGDLFIASNTTQLIYEYNIATGKVIWTSPFINGLDDIVPLVGLGSNTPEPASLSLLGVGVGGLFLRRRRR